MTTEQKIFFIQAAHAGIDILFYGTYVLSFFEPRLFPLVLAGVVLWALSWIPFGACPLVWWKNKLREKIGKPPKRFFVINEAINNYLVSRFSVSLPKGFTWYMIGFLLAIRWFYG